MKIDTISIQFIIKLITDEVYYTQELCASSRYNYEH